MYALQRPCSFGSEICFFFWTICQSVPVLFNMILFPYKDAYHYNVTLFFISLYFSLYYSSRGVVQYNVDVSFTPVSSSFFSALTALAAGLLGHFFQWFSFFVYAALFFYKSSTSKTKTILLFFRVISIAIFKFFFLYELGN